MREIRPSGSVRGAAVRCVPTAPLGIVRPRATSAAPPLGGPADCLSARCLRSSVVLAHSSGIAARGLVVRISADGTSRCAIAGCQPSTFVLQRAVVAPCVRPLVAAWYRPRKRSSSTVALSHVPEAHRPLVVHASTAGVRSPLPGGVCLRWYRKACVSAHSAVWVEAISQRSPTG